MSVMDSSSKARSSQRATDVPEAPPVETATTSPTGDRFGGTGQQSPRRKTWTVGRIPPEGMLLLGVDLLLIVLALPWVLRSSEGAAVLAALILVPTIGALGLYRQRYSFSFLDDLPRLVLAPVIASALAYAVVAIVGFDSPTRVVVHPAFGAAFIAVVVLSRLVTYPLLRALRRRGRWTRPTIIVGGGEVATTLGRYIVAAPETGLRLVGFVDASEMLPEHTLPAPFLGQPRRMSTLLGEHGIDHAIFAFSAMRSSDLVNYIRLCDRAETSMAVVPRLFELAPLPAGGSVDTINGLPLLGLNRAPFHSATWPLKRVLDVAVSSVALVVFSPIMVLIAAWARFTQGPGVLFRQRRVGARGVEFDLLKFRSMKPVDANESDTRWNIKDDDRLTPFGRFIRKTSLDELPQLFNVLRGQMSLVGPRPERPHFVEVFSDADDRYWSRHRVPVGLTGWAQIHGLRGDTSIAERARFDNFYIEHWSLWLDIKIIIATTWSLFKGSG